MKLNRLETHDRLLHFKKDQALNLFQGAEDCFKKNSLSLSIQDKCPYVYIFVHARTADDGVNKVIYWDPRISKPEPQSNSCLFRGISKTDIVEIIWMIPEEGMWKQYQMGNVTEHPTVLWSIHQFKFNPELLAKPHKDDLSEEEGRIIFKKIIDEHIEELRRKQRAIVEASQMEKSE